jgi:hypothetical protein
MSLQIKWIKRLLINNEAYMAVKRKAEKSKIESITDESVIDEIINRGGKTTIESEPKEAIDEEVRLTLRLPKSLVDKIDEKRKERPGKISRNQWILDKIFLHLD